MSGCVVSARARRARTREVPVLLIVDDEENVLRSIRRLFHGDGYTILTAQDGFTALEVLDRHEVDVVICDMRMPGMDGIELLSTLRRRHPSVVRIMLTGYVSMDVMEEAVNAGGVYKFFPKPWDDEALRAAVKEALESSCIERVSCTRRQRGGERRG
jgi:DNA-binding NtrC family response regulator